MAAPFKPSREDINKCKELLKYLSTLSVDGIYKIPLDLIVNEIISNDFSDASYATHNKIARLLSSCSGITTRYKWSLSNNFIYVDEVIVLLIKYIEEYDN